jgi:1-acyl-sn-glycerol-3-phosphate acyltransferase
VIFYRVVRAVVLSAFKVLFRVKVEGKEHVPKRGPYIVAPTHRSILDIPFAAFITRRRIRFLAKKELFTTRFGRWLFNRLGAIPVDRNAVDRAALRVSSDALAAGEPVGVFPEGTRHAGPLLGTMHDGASYLALKHGVPIIPVGIGGSEEILASGKLVPRIKRVALVIGEPIPVDAGDGSVRRRSDLTALTGEVRSRLQDCFGAARAAAGVDETARSAGRETAQSG